MITLTPSLRNDFNDWQKAKIQIAVLPNMDLKTFWIFSLQLFERAYQLREFTHEWLKHLKYTDYQRIFTTHNNWTIVKYIMEVSWPFRYWTLWVTKRHWVTLHHVIAFYNDIFHHTEGIMRALGKKTTQWKEDLYLAVKFARQKISRYYVEVTPTTGMLLNSAHIPARFWKLLSFQKWGKGMDINPEDETSYTTQYRDAVVRYVENNHCAKHRRMCVITSEMGPGSILFPL